MSRNYGAILMGAIDRAAAVADGDVSARVRREEIIDLALQGLTVPELRAVYVAHFSGQPMPRGLSRADVAARVRTAALSVADRQARGKGADKIMTRCSSVDSGKRCTREEHGPEITHKHASRLWRDPKPQAEEAGKTMTHKCEHCGCEAAEPASPYVADPDNPTDDELAAAIQRGLADGSLIDSKDWEAANKAEPQVPGGPGPYTHIVKRADGYIAGWFVGEPPDSFIAECNASVPDNPAHVEVIPEWPDMHCGAEGAHKPHDACPGTTLDDYARSEPGFCGSDHKHDPHGDCLGLYETSVPYFCGDCGDEITTKPPYQHKGDTTVQCNGREDAARRYPARFPQDAERYGIEIPDPATRPVTGAPLPDVAARRAEVAEMRDRQIARRRAEGES